MRKLLILSCVLSAVFSAAAKESYSISDGLSNGCVKALYKDDTGYIWLGTKNGLNRFDGYEFLSFFYEEGGLVPKNDIVSITRDSSGKMWIGTFDGVTLFDPLSNHFIPLEQKYEGSLPSGVVVGIYVQNEQRVWAATKRGLYLLAEGVCRRFESFDEKYINCMGYCGDGYLLLDTVSDGLWRVNANTGDMSQVVTHAPSSRDVSNAILYDEGSSAWLFSDCRSILRYDLISGEAEAVPVKVESRIHSGKNQIHCALKNGRGTILIGTDSGVMCFDPVGGVVSDAVQGLPRQDHTRVMSLLKDSDGTLWMGSFEEGFSLYNERMDRVRNLHPSPSGRIIPVLFEDAGELLVGNHKSISAYRLSDGNIRSIRVDEFPGATSQNEIYSISHIGDGRALVYLLNLGAYVLDIRSMRPVRMVTDMDPASQIRRVILDAEGNLWMAANELTKLTPGSTHAWTGFQTNREGYTKYMLTQSLQVERGGSILVGTRNDGLWRYPYHRYAPEPYSSAERVGNALPENINIVETVTDSEGRIWIGTYASGLLTCKATGEDLRKVDLGEKGGAICGIEEDDSGFIWVSTSSGLSMVDPSNLSVISSTASNGYPQKENTQGAMLLASDGNLYIGGDDGISVINPSTLFSHSDPVREVTVSSVASLLHPDSPGYEVFDSPEALQSVRMGQENTSLRIKFSSLAYLFQGASRYAYRMKGSGNEWNYVEGNYLILSNLSYGKHVLQLRCSDEYGQWQDNVTEQVIYITPPIWLTPFAKAVYIILAAGLLIAVFLFARRRRSEKYEKAISQIEKENIEKAYKIRMDLFTQFSHELRTPLTLLKDPVDELLSDDSLPEKYRYPMMQVERNANKMILLVNQLLDLRKIEHGKMQLHLTRLDCRAFLKDQEENFRHAAERRSLSIETRCEVETDNLIVDADLMDRVVANLVSNAIKHSPIGGVIEIGMAMHGEDKVRLWVTDHGEGIAKENIEKIFDPFYQVPDSLGSSFGSGIGLTLARYIVSLHKGQIWVESEVGEGSTFIVELRCGYDHYKEDEQIYFGHDFDLSVPQEEKAEDGDSPETIPEKDDMRKRILVAEDDEELRLYLSSHLERDYDVSVAEDGEQALAMAVRLLPDLIISDVMMPNMDGIEFCRSIKQSLATCHIPVILLTAKVQEESIEEGYRALADDYIPKPFSTKLLMAKCRSVIENRIRLREAFSERVLSEDLAESARKEQDPFMEKMVEYIKANIDSPDLSISALYAEMGMSRAQFFKKVKSISNLSPNRIIISIKMNLAAQMLRGGQYNVSEVAYNTGYSDPSYFSKVFRSVYKITPTDYQKQYE